MGISSTKSCEYDYLCLLMRSLLQRLFNPWLWLVAGLLCAVLSFMLARWNPGFQVADRQANDIQRRFQALDARLGELLRDTALLTDLATECEDAPDTESLRRSPFGVYIYRQNQLLWWSNNQVIPDPRLLQSVEPQPMLRLANGFYVIRTISWGDLDAIGLIPIRSEYSMVNRYLRPRFFPELGIPSQTLLLGSDVPGNTILDARGQAVFSLHFSPKNESAWSVSLLLSLFSFFFLLAGITLLAQRLARKGWGMIASLLLAAFLFGLHWVLSRGFWPAGWSGLPIFDPHYYASPGIAPSLGQLLADSLIGALMGLFLLRYTSPERWLQSVRLPSWIKAAMPVVLLLVLFRAVVNILFSLVADSNIPFDLDNFLQLDVFSFAGLLAVALLLTNVFFFGRWFAKIWNRICARNPERITALVLGSIIYVVVFILLPQQSDPFVLQHLISTVVFLGLAHWFSQKADSERSLLGLLLWTAYFAAFASVLLIRTDQQREEDLLERYASRLASDQDPVMEYLFSGVAGSVRQDPMVRNVFADAYPAVRQAEDQIIDGYLGEYFDRYRTSVYFYNRRGLPLNSMDSPEMTFLDSLISAQGESTGSEGLFHLLHGGRMEYLARIPVTNTDGSGGNIYLRMEAKVLSGTSLYPELLMRDPGFDNPEGYDFAVYRSGRLLNQEGDFPYSLILPTNWQTAREYEIQRIGSWNHMVHRTRDDKVVIVSRPATGWTVPLSLFSYLFLFLLLFTSFFALPILGMEAWRNSPSGSFGLHMSLRGRIQSFVVLLTLLSFIIIGAITISYFNRQSQDYHRSRLLRKLNAVASEIEYESADATEDSDPERRKDPRWPFDLGVQSDLGALSEIHAIDLNIYDTLGFLQQSSQPDIFSKGLLSKVMEPEAWAAMNNAGCSHWIQTEEIGALPFLSAYRPLQSAEGKTMAYLHLPYFAKERNQRQEVSGFMVALVNVYVLLLVVAGLVALGISNSVTRSLAKISAQFQKIKVGERNEPITWKSQDEIGLLVSEYNKMLGQLERSASLLARSERESAWREMARQVAHEIKNPLTPMRLSIQHLQRAIADGDPRAEELTQRVSRTLLEQIETLTVIATEFSNFAQMPTPKPNQVVLGDVLKSIVDLYQVEEAADIQLSIPGAEVLVWADREQLQRVFSNLLKNAIQAIPDDRKGLIHVVMGTFAGEVRVQVIDNGIGIPVEQYQRVFVPNFTTKSSGMGLGLAMCKNIVEYAGGRIEFISKEGSGTTFSVTLPLMDPNMDPITPG